MPFFLCSSWSPCDSAVLVGASALHYTTCHKHIGCFRVTEVIQERIFLYCRRACHCGKDDLF